MAKWTKVDVKTIASQLTSFHLMHRMYAPADVIRAKIEAETTSVVVSGLEGWVAYESGRARENDETASHFAANPNVWGDSTPEMVARFRKMSADSRKGAERARKLAERVRIEGVPPEALEMYRQAKV